MFAFAVSFRLRVKAQYGPAIKDIVCLNEFEPYFFLCLRSIARIYDAQQQRPHRKRLEKERP